MPSNSSRSSAHRGRHEKSSSSSSSSHKHSSKSASKHGNSVVKAAEQDIYHQENTSLWQDVKATEGNSSTLVLALVAPEQRKAMRKLIDDKAKKKKIRSSVIVTTQNQLQEHLGSAMTNSIVAKKAFKTLYLLVSSTVAELTYNIEGFVDKVFIRPCGAGGRPDALRIGTSSTYCGFKAYAWDARPSQLHQNNKELTHLEGCNFDLSDCSRDELRFLQQPRDVSDLSHDDKYHAMQKIQELKDIEVQVEELLSYSHGSWCRRSWHGQRLLDECWGIMVKGPCGLYMAAGNATVGGFWAVGAAGVGSAVAAYGMVYFIPWDRVWDFLRAKLWQIWDKICEVLVWIKDKLTELASTILTKVSLAIQGAPKPARLSM
ncbi:hypothetical protein F52700_747 [Fusarium sp. NRRL 52700]|nr:hypothetical protein F52700_747 [Fusarium sp. NRRL 52700]